MKVLITGARGMVARAAIDHYRQLGDEVIALSRAELDISDRETVSHAVQEHQPEAVVNCAAYTNVDGAETDPETCYTANAVGPENLVIACRANRAKFLTISTDYVFGGEHSGFYYESADPKPLGVYARSKYEGELRVAAADPASVIVRSGWIYGNGGTNFLSVMPDLLAAGKSITAVSDSTGTPTYAVDLVRRIRELLERDVAGIFHVANWGDGTTYFGFARAICSLLGRDDSQVTPVTDADLKRPATRPANSMLASERLDEFELNELPHWTRSLETYLTEKELL